MVAGDGCLEDHRRADIAWGGPGDVPVPADYNGDGRVDPAVFRRTTGQWFIRNVGTVVFGGALDIPVPSDYDGDGDADIAVFERATGQWKVYNGATRHSASAPMCPCQPTTTATAAPTLRTSSVDATFSISNQVTVVVGAVGDLTAGTRPHGRPARRTHRLPSLHGRLDDLRRGHGHDSHAAVRRGGGHPGGRRPQLPLD